MGRIASVSFVRRPCYVGTYVPPVLSFHAFTAFTATLGTCDEGSPTTRGVTGKRLQGSGRSETARVHVAEAVQHLAVGRDRSESW